MTDLSPFFYGSFVNRLNSKGQVAVPKRFRDLVGEQKSLVLLPGEGGCLYMYTHEQFGAVRARVRAIAEEQGSSEFFRTFMEDVSAVDLDAQGRVVLPFALREAGGVGGPDVLFIGMDDRIEIWDPAAREQARGERATYRELRGDQAKRIFGL